MKKIIIYTIASFAGLLLAASCSEFLAPVDHGLVENRVDSSVTPVKSEYRLTDASRELMPCIHEIKMWALKWKIHNPACAAQQCFFCKL